MGAGKLVDWSLTHDTNLQFTNAQSTSPVDEVTVPAAGQR
jgi:hypothetical protein